MSAEGDSFEGIETFDVRAIEPAEPPREAEIVALGEGVRAVTRLIEEVGRTLEAQNQRSLRLMERLEQVAKALESGVEEGDRNLEALDAVEAAIARQQTPLERIERHLARLPEVVRAAREDPKGRETWGDAVRALSSRIALNTAQLETRLRAEQAAAERRRTRRLALALTIGLAAAGTIGAFARDAAPRLLGPGRAVEAEQGLPQYRVIRVRPAEEGEGPAPAPRPTLIAPAMPSGTARSVEIPKEGAAAERPRGGAEPAPAPERKGSLVVEPFVPNPGNDLVPSLIAPLD
jgi:hypothetical protein